MSPMSSRKVLPCSWIRNSVAVVRSVALPLLLWMLMPMQLVQSSLASQKEEKVHRLLQCAEDVPDQQPTCPLGYFCNFQSGEPTNSTCETCPASASQSSQDACRDRHGNNSLAVQDCLDWCVLGNKGDFCSANSTCAPDKFCNYGDGDGTGTCETCKSDVSQCLSADLSESGTESCLECDLNCLPIQFSEVTVGDGDDHTINSFDILGSPSLSVSGPLVDCTNLVFDDETTCPGANNSVCLVEDVTKQALNYEMVWKCEQSGGVALILFGSFEFVDDDEPFDGYLSFRETRIPSVGISFNDGKRLAQHKIGAQANVTVKEKIGDYCIKDQKCSHSIPCLGRWRDGYCAFDLGDSGWCWDCPEDDKGNPDPFACFFDTKGSMAKSQNEIESCAQKCGSSLTFDSCKFCPSDVTAFSFGVERESDRCDFCPMDDVKYPEREVSLFGKGTKCWQMQAFFKSVEVHASSQNCQLAQMMNYICGCEGPGYGGASTETKKRLLAWLPRIMAFLSFLGSSFIIFDASRLRERRRKTFNQIMVVLSVFDLFGSCAYAFTSLPIPADDYIFGSMGNEASCMAQGFFIQLGTISCYTSVSLSVYFLLVIKMGWSERQVKKVRVWLVLFPLLFGLAFAFAGIPFYDNMILWCNNSALWWPDIAVAVAIGLATIIMATVCLHVYQQEKASARWRGGASASGASAHNRVSNMVFWQSFWYLMAFYFTWPPYLALQYSWASGKAYSKYGLILFAGTMVPLQGLWNFFVYVRPRYAQEVGKKVRQSLALHFRKTQPTTSLGMSSHNPKSSTEASAELMRKENFDGEETAQQAHTLTTIPEGNLDERIHSSASIEEVQVEDMIDEETTERNSEVEGMPMK